MRKSTLRITKMHGLGNNYIYINRFEEALEEAELPELARRLSDVYTGIGSDGLILIGPSEAADFQMRIFNNDGSEGKNCGNGLRCVAKYVYERKLTDKTAFAIETLGGIVHVDLQVAEGAWAVRSVRVNMGKPRLARKELPMTGDPERTAINEEIAVAGKPYRITAVSMGNPHIVQFVPDVAAIPLEEIGPQLECDSLFPERVNVEFVSIRNKQEIDFRVWERGSGITQACGTGACAAVVAGVLNGLLDMDTLVTVHLPGGDLKIEWSERDGQVYMEGPAEFIMDGEFQWAANQK